MHIEKRGILEDVLPEDYLELGNGIVIKNIKELLDVLEKMDESEFKLYVYHNHNDFAEWILESHWDDGLASKLLKIKKKDKMIKFLKVFLKKEKFGELEKIGKRKSKSDVLSAIKEVE